MIGLYPVQRQRFPCSASSTSSPSSLGFSRSIELMDITMPGSRNERFECYIFFLLFSKKVIWEPTRRAEPALRAVRLVDPLLHRVEPLPHAAQALDRRHRGAVQRAEPWEKRKKMTQDIFSGNDGQRQEIGFLHVGARGSASPFQWRRTTLLLLLVNLKLRRKKPNKTIKYGFIPSLRYISLVFE